MLPRDLRNREHAQSTNGPRVRFHKNQQILRHNNHFLNTLYLDSGVGWILARFLTCSNNKAPGLERLLNPESLFSFVNGK